MAHVSLQDPDGYRVVVDDGLSDLDTVIKKAHDLWDQRK